MPWMYLIYSERRMHFDAERLGTSLGILRNAALLAACPALPADLGNAPALNERVVVAGGHRPVTLPAPRAFLNLPLPVVPISALIV